jgi:FAD/FMN-containing dehydrogenase
MHGWGRFPQVDGLVDSSEDLAAATRDANLSAGLFRSYGDAALPAAATDRVVQTVRADRVLRWEGEEVAVEAGASVARLAPLLLARGRFLPVTPGTQHVTVGGMVAADVHGKNHHSAGTFGAHVLSLRMRLGDGRIVRCSPERQRSLFAATVGGMGLTGHILEVTFRAPAIDGPWILQRCKRCPDMDTLLSALADARASWPMTVGWFDALHPRRRGIVLMGRWSSGPGTPHWPAPLARVPLQAPDWVLGRMSVGLFNRAYYARPLTDGLVSPFSYFYPLDALGDWNRLYGRRGLLQYQCVLPDAGAVHRLLDRFASFRAPSFLSVVKDFGAEGLGVLSFPKAGFTVNLDIPRRPHAQAVVDALNRIVMDCGGRIYLAKDALTRADHFAAMEGERMRRFRRLRARWDPEGRIRSALSARLDLRPE